MVLLTTKARVFLLMQHAWLTTTTHTVVGVVTSTMLVRSAVANSVCQGLKLGSVLVLVSLQGCWSFLKKNLKKTQTCNQSVKTNADSEEVDQQVSRKRDFSRVA